MSRKERNEEFAQEFAPFVPARVSMMALGRPHQKLEASLLVQTLIQCSSCRGLYGDIYLVVKY